MHSGHRHLLLERSSLPFASIAIQACPLPAFKCLKCFAAASTRPEAFVVRAFKPAVCLHSLLLLGRSSLPFARLQMPKMLRGSFDEALWPEAFVVRPFKPAVCLHSHRLLGRSSLPFARLQMPKMLRGSFDQALWPQAFVVRAFKPAVCLHSRL